MAVENSDLYDNEDGNLDTINNANNNENENQNDIMDAALTSNRDMPSLKRNGESKLSGSNEVSKNSMIVKQIPVLSTQYDGPRFGIYLANLNWWTTDRMIYDLCVEAQLDDLLDIKFYENKSNGVSRGFAMVLFSSRESCEISIQKFSNQVIDGFQKIVAMPGTKQNYDILKAKCSDGYHNQPKQRFDNNSHHNNSNNSNNYHNNNNNNASSNSNFNNQSEFHSTVQNILKNPNLLKAVVGSANSTMSSTNNNDESNNQSNFSSWDNSSNTNNQNDSVHNMLKEKVSQVIQEAKELAETDDLRKAVFKLMDCAEEIRQSEISKDRRAKYLLDSIYDTKRELNSKYEWKKPSFNNHNNNNQNSSQYARDDKSPDSAHRDRRRSRRSRSRSPPQRSSSRRSYSPPSRHHRSSRYRENDGW